MAGAGGQGQTRGQNTSSLLPINGTRRDDILGLAAVGIAPALIYTAHAFFGAALDLPALLLFAALCLVLVGALAFRRVHEDLNRLTPVWLLFGLFACTILIALLSLTDWSPEGSHPLWAWLGLPGASTLNRSATSVEILKLIGLGACFALGCIMGARPSRARRTVGMILALGAVYSAVSLIVFLTKTSVNLSGVRLSGGFESANVAGTQFGCLIVLAVAWGIRVWNQGNPLDQMARITDMAPVVALALLFGGCLLLTASRGAIGATGLALALLAAWAALDNRRARWPLILGGAALAIGVVVFYLQGNTLFVDRFGLLAQKADGRAPLIAAHWEAFQKAPLFGYGLGTFSEVNNQVMTSQNATDLSTTIVLHNAYLQWLEEAGLIGSAPFFLLLAIVLGATGWRAFVRRRNRTLVVGLLATSLVVLLHAAVDVSLNTPSFEAFWSLILGLGFSLSQVSRGAR